MRSKHDRCVGKQNGLSKHRPRDWQQSFASFVFSIVFYHRDRFHLAATVASEQWIIVEQKRLSKLHAIDMNISVRLKYFDKNLCVLERRAEYICWCCKERLKMTNRNDEETFISKIYLIFRNCLALKGHQRIARELHFINKL